MRFRLGFVAMTLNLKDCSPSGTVTFTAFNRLPDWEAKLYRLRKITARNLENTLRILKYSLAYNIKVYRITSKLVPLATHPAIEGWDYAEDFKDEFKQIGDFVKENGFRISAHPDHYTLINSSSRRVVEESLRDLDYHIKVFEAMGLTEERYKLVMHVGGLYRDKESSVERFKENFRRLPERIRKRIMLENDDKSFTAADVLGICRELGIPMVLDVHHHRCVSGGEKLRDLLPAIFDTWNGGSFPPKIHFSTPRSREDFRSHADDIDPYDFVQFLDIARQTGRDFDVMLEAKNKDTALLRLSEKLSGMEGIVRVNEGEFIVR